MTGRVFTFSTTTVIVLVVVRMIFATVFFLCLWCFFVATRFFGFRVRFTTSIGQRWCQKETKHHYQHYGNLSCHIFSVCKGINFFVRVCWQKMALLVLWRVGLCVGQNQMCHLCGRLKIVFKKCALAKK